MKILLFAVLLFLATSCSKDYDPYQYETRLMAISNADNSTNQPFDADNTAPRLAYGIKVAFKMFLTDKSGDTDSYESSFINEDELVGLNITSPDTINEYLPFSSLNAIFNYSTGGSTGSVIQVDDYWYYASGGRRGPDGLLDSWEINHYLFLMDPPNKNDNYTFIVDLAFSDGRLLTDTVNVNLY